MYTYIGTLIATGVSERGSTKDLSLAGESRRRETFFLFPCVYAGVRGREGGRKVWILIGLQRRLHAGESERLSISRGRVFEAVVARDVHVCVCFFIL